jgi:hypothetical protein
MISNTYEGGLGSISMRGITKEKIAKLQDVWLSGQAAAIHRELERVECNLWMTLVEAVVQQQALSFEGS